LSGRPHRYGGGLGIWSRDPDHVRSVEINDSEHIALAFVDHIGDRHFDRGQHVEIDESIENPTNRLVLKITNVEHRLYIRRYANRSSPVATVHGR